METWNELDEWADRYVRGDLSREDRIALMKWLEASPEHIGQFRKILRVEMRVAAVGKWRRLDRTQERVWKRITPVFVNRKKRLYLWWMRIAAIIIVLIGVYFVWQIRQMPTEKFVPVAEVVKIESGSPKAILVMNAGEPIELKEGESRQVADVFGVKVIQDSTGGLRFEDREGAEEEIGKSSVIVPEKGEYFVILSDGTKVWINSDSELEFPNRFGEDIREVKLKGEAYFRVARNEEKPFYVESDGQLVRVYGTEFNIRTYEEDAAVYTTLISGSVALQAAGKLNAELFLTPGRQAVFDKKEASAFVRTVDTEVVTGWRRGLFVFEEQNLGQIMAALARWYNFDYEFTDNVLSETVFMGSVPRYGDFNEVLEILEKSGGVKFRMNGKTVTVSAR